jgi:tricorn protease
MARDIWRRAAGSMESRPIPVHSSRGSLVAGGFSSSANTYAMEIAVSSDGSAVAIVARGEIFVTATAGGRTRRITSTPEFKHHISFNPDGRTLLYCSKCGRTQMGTMRRYLQIGPDPSMLPAP